MGALTDVNSHVGEAPEYSLNSPRPCPRQPGYKRLVHFPKLIFQLYELRVSYSRGDGQGYFSKALKMTEMREKGPNFEYLKLD